MSLRTVERAVALDTHRYSVPWKLIGKSVTVVVAERQVRVLYAAEEVACHAQNAGRRISIIERSHLVGIVGAHLVGASWLARPDAPALPEPPSAPAELLRPLTEYETSLGGGW